MHSPKASARISTMLFRKAIAGPSGKTEAKSVQKPNCIAMSPMLSCRNQPDRDAELALITCIAMSQKSAKVLVYSSLEYSFSGFFVCST